MGVRIVAYTYDADTHCPSCAEKRWGLEEHGRWVREDATDREGNTVHPVFSTDELEDLEVCGTCREMIR